MKKQKRRREEQFQVISQEPQEQNNFNSFLNEILSKNECVGAKRSLRCVEENILTSHFTL